MSLNAAIVGVSGYGRVHYNLMRDEVLAGRLKPVGATIINRADEAEIVDELSGMGCRIFDDYQAMLRALSGQVDICFLPTPIHFHAPMTIQALEAGWNVLVEKPLAPTIQEVRDIQATERSTGRFAAVGFQEVYSPHAHELKTILLSGKLGRVRSMKGRGLWPRSFSYYGRNSWAGHLRVGGRWVLDSPLHNALSHYLHLLFFLSGKSLLETAKPIRIEGELYRAQAIQSFDTGCIRVLTDSGISILFHATHSSREQIDPEIVIEAERGRVEWSVHGECRIFRDGSEEPYQVTGSTGNQRHAMGTAVMNRLTDPNAFVCTTESAASHALAINGLHESSVIHPFPHELLETIDEGDDQRTIVDGLGPILDDAFRKGQLFSEAGIDWARPGREVDLTDYRFFPAAGGLADRSLEMV